MIISCSHGTVKPPHCGTQAVAILILADMTLTYMHRLCSLEKACHENCVKLNLFQKWHNEIIDPKTNSMN